MKYVGTKSWGIFIPAVIIILLLTIHLDKSSSKQDEECLSCHSDSSLTTEKNGKSISLYVDTEILADSEHDNLDCIECHVGFNKDNLPHKENIQPVNCSSCHKNALRKHSKKRYVDSEDDYNDCKSCHGTHDAQEENNKLLNIYDQG